MSDMFSSPPSAASPQPGAGLSNFYLAAVPTPEVADRLEAAWMRQGTQDAFRGHLLHLSILSLRVPHGEAERACRVAYREMAALIPAVFDLVFDRITTFSGKGATRPIVASTGAGSAPLSALAERIRRPLALCGLAGRAQAVTPHVTLAYGTGFDGSRMLAAPIPWRVTEVVLIESFYGQGRRAILGRWPLGQTGSTAAGPGPGDPGPVSPGAA